MKVPRWLRRTIDAIVIGALNVLIGFLSALDRFLSWLPSPGPGVGLGLGLLVLVVGASWQHLRMCRLLLLHDEHTSAALRLREIQAERHTVELRRELLRLRRLMLEPKENR